MTEEQVQALLKRAQQARGRRDAIAGLMQACYRLAMPERDSWSQAGGSGGAGNVRARIYDSTAVASVSRFANRLVQALFPPDQRWAALRPAPALESRPDPELDQMLDDATKLLFQHVAASRFDSAINEWAHDLAAGTACLLIQNGRLGGRAGQALFQFTAVPVGRVAIDEGPDGAVDGVFFEQDLPARNVRRASPDARTIPDDVLRSERDAPETVVRLQMMTVFDVATRHWVMAVVHEGSRTVLVERRMRTNPWIITRWLKIPGEVWGRGPLMMALPDVQTLNKTLELLLKNASLELAGVWTARDDGIFNPAVVRMIPGAIIPVGSNGGPLGATLKRLESGTNFNVSQLVIDKMQTGVRQMLFDNPLPPEVQAGLTATEVSARIRQFQQDTGAFGRLNAEAVAPIVLRLIDILDDAGELPGALDWFVADRVRAVATSPLALVQSRADAQSVLEFINAMASLGQMGGMVIQNSLDQKKLGPWLARQFGVPAALVPKPEEQDAAEQATQTAQQTNALLTSPVVAQLAGALARGVLPQGAAQQAPAAEGAA